MAAQRLTRARIRSTLARAGRRRNLDERADAIDVALHAPQLAAAPLVEQAYGAAVRSTVALLRQFNHELEALEAELVRSVEQHPDAEILCSLPGLGAVLGARVLSEFGDDPTRYHDARSRRCYAGTAPITRASGTRFVVLARTVRNRRLAHACYLWAYSSLRPSPGARRYHDRQRAKGKSHHQALRALANRWVGVMHGCLVSGQRYDEAIAWRTPVEAPLDNLRSWDVWPCASRVASVGMPPKLRDVIAELTADGWRQTSQRAVTASSSTPPSLARSPWPDAWAMSRRRVRWQASPGRAQGTTVLMNRCIVVLEGDAATNYSAYVPDLPGCIATGATIEETVRLIREAIALHIDAMQRAGERVPAPTTRLTDRDLELTEDAIGVIEVTPAVALAA